MSMKSKVIWLFITAIIIVLGVWYYQSRPQYANVDSPRPIKGDAKSTIIVEEFSDFQCPACGAAQPTVDKILQTYGDKIAFAYRHFPLLSIHANAFSAALAAECANDQGKFWEYHDLLFKNQKDLRQAVLLRLADEAGLNKESFSACLFYLNGQLVENWQALSGLIGAEVSKLGVTPSTTPDAIK